MSALVRSLFSGPVSEAAQSFIDQLVDDDERQLVREIELQGDRDWCEQHGWADVLDVHSSRGFAGGAVYVTDLSCGCQQIDDSDDLLEP